MNLLNCPDEILRDAFWAQSLRREPGVAALLFEQFLNLPIFPILPERPELPEDGKGMNREANSPAEHRDVESPATPAHQVD